MEKYIEVGKIVSAHGIKGEVRTYSFLDDKIDLLGFDNFYLSDEKTILKVEKSRVHKNIIVFKFENINDRNTAETYINKILYINKEYIKIEEGSFLISDLIGSAIVDVDTHENYGELEKIIPTAGVDIYEVREKNGKSFFLPAVDEFIMEINAQKKIILIRPIEGLIDINSQESDG